MITRPLLEHIFAAASIERWNDHPHPAVFTELGKQAHKMVAAWVLGRAEEKELIDSIAIFFFHCISNDFKAFTWQRDRRASCRERV